MKDYRLSEIKEICSKYIGFCENCECNRICHTEYFANNWDIEPRDIIELPCKEHRVTKYDDLWDVYYREEKHGFVRHVCWGREAEADAFLEELKKK